MTDRQQPDFNRVPGAHLAYHLPMPGTAPPQPPPEQPSRWSRYRKALVITVVSVVGTGGIFGGIVGGVVQYFSNQANKVVEQAFSEALFAFDVEMLTPPDYHHTGYAIPGSTTDADFNGIDWDPVQPALPTAAWTVAQGGSAVGWGQWEIALEGNRDETVTVTDLYATDIECSAPESGTYFPVLSQGIGEKIGLAIEIDDPGARIKELPTGEPNSFDPPDLDALPAFSDSATITLDRGEKEVITFQAHADEEYCEFALAIEYLAEGERQTSLIAPEVPRRFAVAPVLDYAEYESVMLAPWFCIDGERHVVSGERAEEFFTGTPGAPTDCT